MSTTSRTRRAKAPAPMPPPAPPPMMLSIRMYDVGFGDCFLLRIPRPDGPPRKVLFDCGSVALGAIPMKDVVSQVIDDCRDAPGGRAHVDIVVATHRHRDHVSGFADPAWAQVEVGEVWMPWTEEPVDTVAGHIREMQDRLAFMLAGRLQAKLDAASDPVLTQRLDASLQIALNAQSNETAMRTLHQGFAGAARRRYLPDKANNATWFNTACLPDVTIHVLGPSRDERIMRDLNPPAGQSYLAMTDTMDTRDGSHRPPFGPDWTVSPPEYDSAYAGLAFDLPASDRTAVQAMDLNLEDTIAATLDKALNGTSLMLVLQVGAATLLFPGDAQWGTWQIALENPDFRKLLGQTTFYKVGHHGSHNATPVEFVQKVMSKQTLAVMSTKVTGMWPSIPKPELEAHLRAQAGLGFARSDQPAPALAPFWGGPNGVIETVIPF